MARCWERWRSLCTNTGVSIQHLLSYSKAVFTASVPLSTQLIMQYISLYCTCLIASCVIPDGTFFGKFNLHIQSLAAYLRKSLQRGNLVVKLVSTDKTMELFPLHIVEWLSMHVIDLTSSPDSFFFFIFPQIEFGQTPPLFYLFNYY